MSNGIMLRASFNCLKFNNIKLQVLGNNCRIWFSLSDILLLTKLPDLLITLQIEVLLLSERLARVSVESIPCYTTNFSDTV